MATQFWIRGMAIMLTLLATACATPPAQVSTVSSRNPQYDRTVKRMVVVVGNLGVLNSRAVRSQLLDQLKLNEVNALVLEHNPLVFGDPILANQDAVRALRPHAILHLQALRWTDSLRTNVQSTFEASLTVPAGGSVWNARFIMHGFEQGEAVLVAELMKKLIEDRIIDKNAVEPDDGAWPRRT